MADLQPSIRIPLPKGRIVDIHSLMNDMISSLIDESRMTPKAATKKMQQKRLTKSKSKAGKA
jgi:hypothetical protein